MDDRITEEVLRLHGEFDGPAFCRIRDLISAATPSTPIVLDFRDVHFCQPLALADLFELIGGCRDRVRTRGLCRQHDMLLGYLGLGHGQGTAPQSSDAGEPPSEAAFSRKRGLA